MNATGLKPGDQVYVIASDSTLDYKDTIVSVSDNVIQLGYGLKFDVNFGEELNPDPKHGIRHISTDFEYWDKMNTIRTLEQKIDGCWFNIRLGQSTRSKETIRRALDELDDLEETLDTQQEYLSRRREEMDDDNSL